MLAKTRQTAKSVNWISGPTHDRDDPELTKIHLAQETEEGQVKHAFGWF